MKLASESPGLNIFVTPGDYQLKNHGDSAMLLTAFDRLASEFAGAAFRVTSAIPDDFRLFLSEQQIQTGVSDWTRRSSTGRLA